MKQHSSRILPIAFSAVLVLGACGSDDSSADNSIDTVAPQPGLRAPSPIQVAAGGTGASSAASSMAEDSAATDRMIAPSYWISEYQIGDGMPALPTGDVGYVFDAAGEVSAEQVAQLAAALGVTGDPIAVDPDSYGSWRVGPEDGSAPSLWVSNDAQQSWNYNGAWQENGARVDCAVSVDSNGVQSEDCPEPIPPVGVPTEQDARQLATDVLTALGEDVSGLEVESYGDEWFASVTFRTSAFYGAGPDDRVSLREWNFGFGADAVMQYASGWLADAEQVGPYPLIDLDTALARLNDGSYGYGSGGMLGVTDVMIAASAPGDAATEVGAATVTVVAETAVAEPAVGVPEGGIEPAPVEPLPVEPMPEPEARVVTLVDVQPDLWWAWDVDGSVWLLPAYRFIDSEGGWHVVPAVTDEFLIQVEPPVLIEPMPMPLPVEPPVAPPPAIDPELFDTSVLEPFVGLTVTDFTAQAEGFGATVRVVEQDGVDLPVTLDYSPSRVNVAVEGDVVTGIVNVG